MKFFSLLILFASNFICSCNVKYIDPSTHTTAQLYPLVSGDYWEYVDSFFDVTQTYYGFDTFTLKPQRAIIKDNHSYTPITDQFGDPIFTVRSDTSFVYILESPGEALLFSSPLPPNQSYLQNSYFNDTLNSIIYTKQIETTNYPSYKIIITHDDGLWYDYKQEEYYFAVGIGIVKGYMRWKNSNGNIFTSDSFILLGYYLN